MAALPLGLKQSERNEWKNQESIDLYSGFCSCQEHDRRCGIIDNYDDNAVARDKNALTHYTMAMTVSKFKTTNGFCLEYL